MTVTATAKRRRRQARQEPTSKRNAKRGNINNVRKGKK